MKKCHFAYRVYLKQLPHIKLQLVKQLSVFPLIIFASCHLFAQATNGPVYNTTYSAGTNAGTVSIASNGTTNTTLLFVSVIPANTTIFVKVDDNANVSITALTAANGSAGGTQISEVGPDNITKYLAITPTAATQSVKVVISGTLFAVNSTKVYCAFYNTLFAADCGNPIATAVTGGVLNAANAINSSTSNYSSFPVNLVSGPMSQTIQFNGFSNAADGADITLANGMALNLLSSVNITVQAYNGKTTVGNPQTVSQLFSALGLGSTNAIATVHFVPNSILPFDNIVISLSGTSLGSGDALRVYNVQRTPTPPTVSASATTVAVCNVSTGSVTGPQSPQYQIVGIGVLTYNWYASAVSTAVLTTSTSLVPSVSLGSTGLNVPATVGTYTYYVNTGKGCAGDTSFLRTLVTISVVSCVTVNAKVFLQGIVSGGAMTTLLSTGSLVPLVQPYGAAPFSHVSSAVEAAVTAIPTGITDWVLVELRNSSNTIIASRAAFLKSDGTLLDVDGTTGVNFPIAAGSFNLAIRHRNHLGVRTATVRSFAGGINQMIDFTTGAMLAGVNDVYTNANLSNTPQAAVGGIFALWGGDVNADGIVTVVGPSNDAATIVTDLSGNLFGYIDTQYLKADVNLDKVSTYIGPGNDYAWIIANVLGGNLFGYFTEHL